MKLPHALLLSLAIASQGWCGSVQPPDQLLPLCESALSACSTYTRALEAKQQLMGEELSFYRNQIDYQQAKGSIWAYTAIGAAGGAMTGAGVGGRSDAALGAAVGGLTGLGIGLILRGLAQ